VDAEEVESGSIDGKGVGAGGTRQVTEDGGSASGMDQDVTAGTASGVAGGGGSAGTGKELPAPPSKKYRMTEAMKNIVWQLVVLSNELCRLENEKK
jgi:hypothetical protein